MRGVQGPFDIGESFEHLKRKIDRTYEGFVIRPDPKHIEDIAKKADIKIGNYKKTPARSDLGKRDGSAELPESEVSEFRSIVGKMLYIGGGRPDCQFAINALAAWMSKPTKTAWIGELPGRHGVLRTAHQEQQVWEAHAGHERNAEDRGEESSSHVSLTATTRGTRSQGRASRASRCSSTATSWRAE